LKNSKCKNRPQLSILVGNTNPENCIVFTCIFHQCTYQTRKRSVLLMKLWLKIKKFVETKSLKRDLYRCTNKSN